MRGAVFEPFAFLRGNGGSEKLSNRCKATQLESRDTVCWLAGSLLEDQPALASCPGLLHPGLQPPRTGWGREGGAAISQRQWSAEETHPPDKQSISFQSWSSGGGGATSAQVFIETDVWDGKREPASSVPMETEEVCSSDSSNWE